MMNPKMTPTAQLGDLATIEGYANRLFRVDSYTHEFTFERGIETEDIYYDCTCVTAGEYTLGAQEDLTVVCREGQTEEFLKTYKHPEIDVIAADMFEGMFGNIFGGEAEQMTKPIRTIAPKEPTKVPSKQERIDALLDDMNDVKTVVALIGDDGGDYGRRLDEIKAELEALTG